MWPNRGVRALSTLGTAALVAAVLCAFPSSAHAAPVGECQPGLGVGLVETPANNQDPRASSYIVDQVKPGSSLSRRFQVCNGTDAPVTVQLYGNAAVVRGGAFTVVEGHASNELSGWISVTPSSVTVPAGKRAIARAMITVPAGVPAGERYAVILAELPPAPGSNGVAVASRVGIRIYLDVAGEAKVVTDFVIDSLRAGRRKDGTTIVDAAVHNTGGRAIDMRGRLTLTEGPGGLSAGPFPATLGTTLAPGETEPVAVVLSKAVTGGPWLATLTLQSGLLVRQATARITFPDSAGEQAAPVAAKNLPLAKDRKVLIPLAGGLIGIVLLVLLGVLLVAQLRKPRRRRPRA